MKSKDNQQLESKENNVVFTLSEEQFERLLETIKSEKRTEIQEQKKIKNAKCRKFMPIFIRTVISIMFVCFGLLMVSELTNNIGNYWKGDFANGFAVVLTYLISFGIIGCGISVFCEKDKNYIIGVASLFVAFVALLVAFIK